MIRDYHHLRIEVPDGWVDEVTLSLSGADTLRLVPDAPTGCVLIFLPEVALPSVDAQEVLEAFIAGHTGDRTVISESELDLGTSDGGLLFAARQVFSQGEDVWYCMYWALGTGEHVQCMVASASSRDGYDELLPHVGSLVDRIHVAA